MTKENEMSKELVERLRVMAAETEQLEHDEGMREAADEIERLNGIIEEAWEYQEWSILGRALSKAHKVKE